MNNDRFKFRVWDKEKKCYQEKDADSCCIRYDGLWLVVDGLDVNGLDRKDKTNKADEIEKEK